MGSGHKGLQRQMAGSAIPELSQQIAMGYIDIDASKQFSHLRQVQFG